MTIMDTTIGRRTFLVGAGASGLIFGFAAHDGIRLADAATAKAFAPNLWFSMDAAGKTVIRIDKAEMGQHVGTALAQILADELEVKWSDISLHHIGFDPKVGLHVTGGSWSVNWTFDRMSRAGAAGRIALIEAAAKKWGVPADKLSAKDSVISGPGGKKISYAELVKAGVPPKAFTKEQMAAIKLKAPAQRRYVGKDMPALDIPAKTNGTAGFAIDVVLDGMVYATPALPPVRYGAKVKSVDDSAAKKIKGYQTHVVINDPTGSQTGWVMAVANSYWTARKAALALKIDYDLGPNAKVSSKSINDESRRLIEDTKGASTFLKEGDAEKALASAKITHEAVYTTTLNIHAPLEPLNATVEIRDGVYNIYTGNQFQTLAMGLVPAALGVKPDKVRLHQQFLGGGFGRRLEADYLIMAALTAKAVNKPVKMIYSREADTEFDFTRPMTVMSVKAGSDGKTLTGWKHAAASSWATARMAPGFLGKDATGKKFDPFQINGSDHWYSIPNQLVLTEMNKIAQSATPSGQLAFGGPRLDLLGRGEHDRRDGPQDGRRSARPAPAAARRQGQECRQGADRQRREAAGQRPPEGRREGGLRQDDGEEYRHRPCRRVQPGACVGGLDGDGGQRHGQPGGRLVHGEQADRRHRCRHRHQPERRGSPGPGGDPVGPVAGDAGGGRNERRPAPGVELRHLHAVRGWRMCRTWTCS